MKKIIIVLAAIVVVVLIAFGIFFIIQNNTGNNTPVSTPGTLPPVSTSTPVATVIPTSTTIALGTSQGSVVVSNFYTTANYITQDQQTVVLQQNLQYDIEYNVADSSFGIGLLSTPLEADRQAAESAFLSKLGISQQDACKLTVYEGVPADVSSQYVGQSFPLSFCGGPPTL